MGRCISMKQHTIELLDAASKGDDGVSGGTFMLVWIPMKPMGTSWNGLKLSDITPTLTLLGQHCYLLSSMFS